MEIHLHTYTSAITENEMSIFWPKISSATHIFYLLRSLLCQSALLLTVLQPLPLFWILPTADDILKPLHMKNQTFSQFCVFLLYNLSSPNVHHQVS